MDDGTLVRYRRHLRAQGYAANTIRAKVEAVERLTRLVGVEPEAITLDHVLELMDRPLEPWTRRKYLEHLRAFAGWAGIEDPTAGLRAPHRPRGVPRPVSEQQLSLMLAVAPRRARAYIVLGSYAGLRSFEVAKVRGADFEDLQGAPVLRVAGKGGRVDLIPLPEFLLREMIPWRREAGLGRLFPRASAGSVQSAVRAVARKASVPVSCHQLRHRYGTALYAASHDLLLVQRLMRHSSPATTAGYALVLDEVGARLVDRLPLPAEPAATPPRRARARLVAAGP